MIALATLMALLNQVSGTPYIVGGDTPAGTDCSGLASWVSNVATGRPAFGDRFNTGNQESALLARGFEYGTQPGALVIGWNGGHTAVTLPDGTPVSSGEGGGVKIGGGGAYQPGFTQHMFLPIALDQVPPMPPPPGAPLDPANPQALPPLPPPPGAPAPAPAPEPVVVAAALAPAPGPLAPAPGLDPALPPPGPPPPNAIPAPGPEPAPPPPNAAPGPVQPPI